jgi:hypothetical protein
VGPSLRISGNDALGGGQATVASSIFFAVFPAPCAIAGSQSLEIAVREIGIALPDVVDRLVHPLPLIVLGGLDHAAAVDVAEQLVACAVQELLFGQNVPP